MAKNPKVKPAVRTESLERQLKSDLGGKGNAALVGTEADAAGESPAERVAADGFTDTEGEGRV